MASRLHPLIKRWNMAAGPANKHKRAKCNGRISDLLTATAKTKDRRQIFQAPRK